MPEQPMARKPALVVLIDALEEQPATLQMKEALLQLANVTMLQPSMVSWHVGLMSIKRQPDGTAKLQMLHKIKPVQLKEWHQAVNTKLLSKGTAHSTAAQPGAQANTSAALRSVLQLMLKEHHQGIVHVVSSGFESNALLQHTVQQAGDGGLDGGAAGAQPMAQLMEFKAQMAQWQHVTVSCVTLDEPGVQVMLADLWQQVQQFRDSCSGPSKPLREAVLRIGVPGEAEQHFMCSIASQIMYLDSNINNATPAAVPAPTKAPHASGEEVVFGPQQHQIRVTSLAVSCEIAARRLACQQGQLDLKVEATIKAANVNQALLFGWPYILQPRLGLGDALDVEGVQSSRAEELLAGLCQVLEAGKQVIIASSYTAISSATGSYVHPTATKQLYCLTPCASPPSMLLRCMACQEQLVPVDVVNAGEQGVSQDTLDKATALVQQLSRSSLGDVLLASACHADLARLVLPDAS